jgi:hypothetical protein
MTSPLQPARCSATATLTLSTPFMADARGENPQLPDALVRGVTDLTGARFVDIATAVSAAIGRVVRSKVDDLHAPIFRRQGVILIP